MKDRRAEESQGNVASGSVQPLSDVDPYYMEFLYGRDENSGDE